MLKEHSSLWILPLCLSVLPAYGQKDSNGAIRYLNDKGWDISLHAGYNIGGCVPLPMPDEIKSINGYNPRLNMCIGADFTKTISNKWGMKLSIRFESKGMEANVTVENYHTLLSRNGDLVEGYFTGKESTNTEHTLITMPIGLQFQINKILSVHAGTYISYALKTDFSGKATEGYIRTLGTDPITGNLAPIGNRIDITPNNPATYDFSDKMRHWGWGIEIGLDCQCFKHLMVFANIDWGLNDIFRSSFDSTISFPMYPIYTTIGFGYSF